MRTIVVVGVAGALAAAGCAAPRATAEPAPSVAFPPASLASAAEAFPSWAPLSAPAEPRSALEDAAAAASAPPPSGAARADGLRFEITPFAWVPAIQGTIGVGQLDGALDLSIGDFADTVTENAQNLLVLHAEAGIGRFGLFGEVIYLDLKGEGERSRTFGGQQIGPITIPPRTGTIEAEVGFTSTTAELAGTYRLVDAEVTGDVKGRGTVDLLAGARWYEIENTVDLTPGPDVKLEEEWLDPIVGLRISLPLGESVSLVCRADVGGFDLGDASELSYRANALLRWDVSKHVGVLVGWGLLDVDYETGSGRDRFEYDVRMSGPVAALTIVF